MQAVGSLSKSHRLAVPYIADGMWTPVCRTARDATLRMSSCAYSAHDVRHIPGNSDVTESEAPAEWVLFGSACSLPAIVVLRLFTVRLFTAASLQAPQFAAHINRERERAREPRLVPCAKLHVFIRCTRHSRFAHDTSERFRCQAWYWRSLVIPVL